MGNTPQPVVDFLPFLIYLIGVFALVGLMFGLSYVLGEHHKGRYTGTPFESGMRPTGSARLRFSARFYLVAMLFVLFDLEAVFIIAWAVAAREVGWFGYWMMFVFVVILVAGLIYEWRVGAFDWLAPGPKRGNRFVSMRNTLENRL